jgi:Uma2 family endonuclease
MIRTITYPTEPRSLADLLTHLGNIPPERIRITPPPGTATEQDVIDIETRENRLCELVDGVLVEKAMGYFESRLAAVLIYYIESFLDGRDLGTALAPDGALRLMPGMIRIPDVSFISWKKLPGRRFPAEPVPNLVPDLAVEILSQGNTPEEMLRKIREYIQVGVRLVWLVDPAARTAEVYTSPRKKRRIDVDGTLEGGSVLPGFRLLLRQLFARAMRRRGQ